MCCLYLCRFVGFRGVSATPTPKSAGIKPPLLDFACYATSYAQNPTSIYSLQLMLLLMPKKPTYAVVRASIMGQGLKVCSTSRAYKIRVCILQVLQQMDRFSLWQTGIIYSSKRCSSLSEICEHR